MRISTNHKTQKTDRQRQAMPFVKCSYSVKDCLQAVADGNPAFLAVLGCANFICSCAIVMVYAMFRLAGMKFSVCYTVPSQGSCLTYPQSRMKADLNSVVCHVKGGTLLGADGAYAEARISQHQSAPARYLLWQCCRSKGGHFLNPPDHRGCSE